ncbi:cysteine--tRNA ligase [Candidatus Woesebacteria bacterium]|nr:cysteine--tRNA ligase [Candidatus Woesebacteria bacterium]
MRLYNTLSRSTEEFTPIQENQVGMYACGFTVYDYTHLGHLRKYSMDDVLVRLLRHEGFTVKFVQNVTDVGHLASDADTGEDKLEKGAKKYGQSVWDIAKKFEDYFFYSMDEMGNLRPDVSCRATEHIAEQIELVKTLEEKGFTYVIAGDGVYFDTSKLDDYGKLAGLTPEKVEQLKGGARVELVEGKRNVTDFALWKFERPGENRAMVWESPWAKRGFPGWHIECSAMSMEYLGDQFDIHTGGIDHIDIHHTNEIAQSEAATGKIPFVKYWVHHNHLRVENEKMSKSLGNFFTIDDVKERGFAPQALRLLFLGSHYRSELNFTWDSLAAAQKAWERLVRLLADLKQVSPTTNFSPVAQEYADQFWSAMRNDLDTPKAMAVFWNVTKAELSPEERVGLLLDFDRVLGLTLAKLDHAQHAQNNTPINIATLPHPVRELLAQRSRARATQDWQRADQLREALHQAGFRIQDSGDNQAVFSLDKS